MAGLFVVCVPTSEYEFDITAISQGKSASLKTTSEDLNKKFKDSKSESIYSLRKTISTTTESLCETGDSCVSFVPQVPHARSTATINTDDNNQDRNNSSDASTYKYYRESRSDTAEGMHHHKALPRVIKKNTADWTKLQNPKGKMTMEKVLEMLLKKLKIENAVWCTVESGRYYQVFFTVDSGDCCEEILRHLNESGIGVELNSVVSVIPCTLHYQGKQQPVNNDCPKVEQVDECKQKSSRGSAWDKFVSSVRARLTVAQVVEGVRADASLTFDFIVLLVLAGLVAAMGLAENSTIVLVASMLISPLMGPIMAGTFGTVIMDRQLQKMGVLNELIGLLVCLVVGFIFGLVAGLVNDDWGNGGWPTVEMISRGQIRSLWVGLLVALPSGAAVAIGILGDNTASLVGVAISASLLPPAVNAGLLWALACVDVMFQGSIHLRVKDYVDFTPYVPIYSQNSRVELLVLGAVSLCLTLINIICIFLAGILVLKIKEVAPRTSRGYMQFWKHDIKIARDYNRTFHGQDAKEIQKRLAEELARTKLQSDLNAVPPNMYSLGVTNQIFNQPATNRIYNQMTWSPSTASFNQESRPTLYDLDRMYASISAVRGQGVMDVNPLQHRRRRHSGGAFWLGESNPQHLLRSDPSTIYSYPSASSRQPSPAASPNEKKIFTVTIAEDPLSDV